MIIKTPGITKVYITKTKYGIIKNVPLDYEVDEVDGAACGCTDDNAINWDPTASEECSPSTCTYLAKEEVIP